MDPDVAAPDEGAEPLLPAELPWIYVFAPFAVLPLLVEGLFRLPLSRILLELGTTYIPFIALSATFHLLYTTLMPKLERRVRGEAARWSLHVAVITVVSVIVGTLVFPVQNWARGDDLDALSFVVVCVVISAAVILPGLVVQRSRTRARKAEARAARERQALLEAQLHVLQARTSPHFFFNTLNTIASLIPRDPVLAERTLERLADIFRYALESSGTLSVTLKREIEVARDYLEVQKARFTNRLDIRVDLDPAAAQVQVPPLLLQPLVENAVLHGLGDRASGRIHVSARRSGAFVTVEIRDDGAGPGTSTRQGTRTGVNDARERLRLVCGPTSSLELSGAPGEGCTVRVCIPLSEGRVSA